MSERSNCFRNFVRYSVRWNVCIYFEIASVEYKAKLSFIKINSTKNNRSNFRLI